MRAVFAAAAEGSRDAQELLFAEHFEGVYVFLRMAMADPETAERGAVAALVTGIERSDECPSCADDVDAWLRGVALERMAAAARAAEREPAPGAAPRGAGADRLVEALAGVSDKNLASLVRALDPITRQVVVLGLMSGLDDATVADIVGIDADTVRRIKATGLLEIARLIERYHADTEAIAVRARENAYHLRPQPGPMSDGVIVVNGSRAMVERGPVSGFWYVTLKALERVAELLLGRGRSSLALDDDVGEVGRRAPTIKRTAADNRYDQPKRTPSMTDYRSPKPTPGMAGYRIPRTTPSTARLSNPRRPQPTAGTARGGLRRKH